MLFQSVCYCKAHMYENLRHPRWARGSWCGFEVSGEFYKSRLGLRNLSFRVQLAHQAQSCRPG
jgi:hypothetical protein